jgi:hypothetical protein
LESGIKATLISTSAQQSKQLGGRGEGVKRKNTNRGRWILRNILTEPEFKNHYKDPRDRFPAWFGRYDNPI